MKLDPENGFLAAWRGERGFYWFLAARVQSIIIALVFFLAILAIAR